MTAHPIEQKPATRRLAVVAAPALVAALAISIVSGVNSGARPKPMADAAPTPYSADHARIAADAGAGEQPPTF
jgi:hypothetical protein